MVILNIFAHLVINATKLFRSIKHIAALRLFLAATICLLFFAQCKNKTNTGANNTKSLEDSLAEKYGKGSEVIAQLTKDITASPENPELYYKRALQWVREEQPAKALSDIKHAVGLQPNNALYCFALGEIYFANDSTKGAMEAFTKATELKPDFTDAQIKLGELQMLLYQFAESNATFDKLLGYEPNNANAYYYKGRNYMGMKDTTQAINSYKKAVSLDNDHFDAFVQLGNVYFAKAGRKNLKLSVDYYTNAIRIKELNAEAYYARALAYLDLSEYEADALQKSLRDNEKVTVISPDDYRPYSNIGYIYLTLNRFEEALDFFNKSIIINPQYVRGYYLRGLTYKEIGNRPEAIKNFETVLQMDSSYTVAKVFLKELGVKDIK